MVQTESDSEAAWLAAVDHAIQTDPLGLYNAAKFWGVTLCRSNYQLPIYTTFNYQTVMGVGDNVVNCLPQGQRMETRDKFCDHANCGNFGEKCAAKRYADQQSLDRHTWNAAIRKRVTTDSV